MKTVTIHEHELDELLRLKDRAVRRDIDAATCGTRYDWRRADEAEDALSEAIEQLPWTD